MPHPARRFAALVLSITACLPIAAQAASPRLDPAPLAALEAAVASDEIKQVTSVLLLVDGTVAYEHYFNGADAETLNDVRSASKSVTSLLIGKAVSLGLIASLDDPAEKYAKDLAGSPYGATTVRQLLRMSSGLVFTERYDGQDDIARLSRASATGIPSPVSVLRSITERHAPAGDKFVYASAESEVLGRVLTGATGRTMAELTTEWLLQPMGAEHDDFWRRGADGQAQAYGGFNASLRDWGRLGLLMANDGKVGDKTVVPQDYLMAATDPSRQPAAFAPRKATPFFGYGYQFWLFPLKTRSFAMQGIHGQAVFVQPASGIVMVQTAVYAHPAGAPEAESYAERTALWLGVLDSLGGRTDRD